MECFDEREQTRFIRWTHRLDVRAIESELAEIFYWMGCTKRDAAARGQPHALDDKTYVPALLMLINKADETGLALEFSSAAREGIVGQREWLRHLKDESWFVFAVCSAEEARGVVMRYLDKRLPPL